MNSATAKALNARKGGWHAGRKKEEWPPMPAHDAARIAAVSDWMQAHRENRRPLTVAAPLLAMVCELHEKQQHLPTRIRLAEALGCTKDGIDAALSTAIAYGEIGERHVTVEGAVAKRRSTRRLRYIDPSPELFAVWKRVKGQIATHERSEARAIETDLAVSYTPRQTVASKRPQPTAGPAVEAVMGNPREDEVIRRSPWPGVLARVET